MILPMMSCNFIAYIVWLVFCDKKCNYWGLDRVIYLLHAISTYQFPYQFFFLPLYWYFCVWILYSRLLSSPTNQTFLVLKIHALFLCAYIVWVKRVIASAKFWSYSLKSYWKTPILIPTLTSYFFCCLVWIFTVRCTNQSWIRCASWSPEGLRVLCAACSVLVVYFLFFFSCHVNAAEVRFMIVLSLCGWNLRPYQFDNIRLFCRMDILLCNVESKMCQHLHFVLHSKDPSNDGAVLWRLASVAHASCLISDSLRS